MQQLGSRALRFDLDCDLRLQPLRVLEGRRHRL